MKILIISICVMAVTAIPFILLARSEARMIEKKKARGEPLYWL